MTGAEIELQLKQYMVKLINKEVSIPEDIATKFSKSILKTFTREERTGFTLSPSMLGKPLCQIQMADADAPRELIMEDSTAAKFATGHMLEAWLVAVMEAAGIPIEALAIPTTLEVYGQTIKGEADIIIDGKVYDVKSCSAYAYKKFGPEGGFGAVAEDDPFGYVVQGFLYAAALGLPFGGWIVANKNTGEVSVCEVPEFQDHHSEAALMYAESVVKAIVDGEEFKRCFEPEDEIFYKKPTGNKVLCFSCSYRNTCWDNLDYRPNVMSNAMSPKWKYYTHIENIPEKKEKK